jgi:hypothetical protein
VEAVGTAKLQDQSVTGVKLATGSVEDRHLAAEAVGTSKLKERSVTGSKLAIGTISTEHLSNDSIDGLHIKKESVSGYHLLPGSISAMHLEPGLLEQLQTQLVPVSAEAKAEQQNLDDSSPSVSEEVLEQPLKQLEVSAQVQSQQLAEGAVTPAQLSFTPVQSAQKAPTLQQFGLAAFQLRMEEEFVDLRIHFDQPFADVDYALVAMTNQTACYSVVQEKQKDYAIIQMVRFKFSPELHGFVNWIAIGTIDAQ